MSAPSGIKVPPALTSAFSSAQANANSVRALVFVIEGEAFSHLTSVAPKGSYKDDIALLPPTLPNAKTPASFAYRLDTKEGGRYEWMMVTFVPDDAGVRAKMLQASSRAGLLKALGANNFKHDWFATNINDLTPAALNAHLNHLTSPPPLTASEAALAEVKAAEQEEAKRAATDANLIAARQKAVVGLAGKTQLQAGVEEALKKVALRSDDGWIVVLAISAGNTSAIELVKSEPCTPSQLATKLPEKSPAYVFYAYPTPPPAPSSVPTLAARPMPARNVFQATAGGARPVQAALSTTTAEPEQTNESMVADADKAAETGADAEDGEAPPHEEPASPASVAPPQADTKGRVIFIYWCPAGSPVKYRMVYSTTVRGIQQDAQDKAEVQIAGKMETSDLSDLSESQLKASLPSKPTHSASLPTPKTNTGSASSPLSATAFGAAFGRPRPANMPIRSASQIPLPASEGPSTPVGGDDEGDSKDRIKNAFDAFGPRVGAGGGGGFARPRPAGRR